MDDLCDFIFNKEEGHDKKATHLVKCLVMSSLILYIIASGGAGENEKAMNILVVREGLKTVNDSVT